MDKTPLARYPQAHKLPKPVKEDFISKIRVALDTNPLAVERAIKVLFDRQTATEKARQATLEDNALGVRHNHGNKVVYYGRWLASGRHLSGHHLDKARKLAHTYAATQLFELAVLKAGLITAEV